MLSRIRKLLQAVSDSPAAGPASPDHRVHVAACAVLLEAAYADYECTDSELDHLIETIQRHFGLSAEEAGELVATAKKEREEAADLWQFTNIINRKFSPPEKVRIMEAVWRIIYVDGRLDLHEDHFAHKLAQLLHVGHSDMITAKIKARDAGPAADA